MSPLESFHTLVIDPHIELTINATPGNRNSILNDEQCSIIYKNGILHLKENQLYSQKAQVVLEANSHCLEKILCDGDMKGQYIGDSLKIEGAFMVELRGEVNSLFVYMNSHNTGYKYSTDDNIPIFMGKNLLAKRVVINSQGESTVYASISLRAFNSQGLTVYGNPSDISGRLEGIVFSHQENSHSVEHGVEPINKKEDSKNYNMLCNTPDIYNTAESAPDSIGKKAIANHQESSNNEREARNILQENTRNQILNEKIRAML